MRIAKQAHFAQTLIMQVNAAVLHHVELAIHPEKHHILNINTHISFKPRLTNTGMMQKKAHLDRWSTVPVHIVPVH